MLLVGAGNSRIFPLCIELPILFRNLILDDNISRRYDKKGKGHPITDHEDPEGE